MLLERVRSILLVPGHRADFAAKCRSYGADQVLWDLEDGVPGDQKALARDVISAHALEGDAVRVTGPEDFEWLATMTPGLTPWIPKVEDLGWVGYTPSPPVALIETPLGVARLPRIASGIFAGLAFGRHDFMASAGLSPFQSLAIDHAAAQVALAALALGIPAYDAPCFSIHVGDLQRETRTARQLGFTGKGCLYPGQIPSVNSGMAPAEEELAWARAILADDGTAEQYAGPPTYTTARKILGKR